MEEHASMSLRQNRHKKIILWGNFGTQNLGNECTLQSILFHLRRFLPDAEVCCICSDPEDTSARHKITAFEITNRHGIKPRVWPGFINTIVSLCRKVFIRIPLELLQWVKAFKILRNTDMLIIPGLGMLGDFGIGPFSLHYEILKWSILAKLRRSKLLFVSVGAGPLSHPLSRWMVKVALSLADYRSYRDCFSLDYMNSINFRTSTDQVYPDLVFSLPILEKGDLQTHEMNGSVIGLGLMDYYGKGYSAEKSAYTYNEYIEKMVAFVTWLVEHKYIVRLLIGDILYDTRAREDIISRLEKGGVQYKEWQIINEPILSSDQLMSQLSETDMVIATRFHNVLLALMLDKPVISISYHEKSDFLMAGFGLKDYCQFIEHLNVDQLKEQFIKLNKNKGSIKTTIQQKVKEYRNSLEKQYTFIFKDIWTG